MSKEIISEELSVTCPYCNKQFNIITWKHLSSKHSKTLDELQIDFPNTPTITRVHKVNGEAKRKAAKLAKEKTVKNIICCNCGIEFKGNVNLSNRFSSCKICTNSGYTNPKHEENYKKLTSRMIKKYGVSNPSLVPKFVEKRNDTVNKKRKNENYFKNIVEKRIETLTEKFGKDYKQVLHQMHKKGMMKIYDKSFALQVDKFNKKRKETNLERRGFQEVFQDPIIKKKIINTNLRTRGVINAAQDPTVASKISHGQTESWKNPDIRKRRIAAFNDNFLPKLKLYLKQLELELLEEYQHAHYKHNWKCLKCNYEFSQIWNFISSGYTCPNCRPSIPKEEKYKAEKEVFEYIENLGFKAIRGNRHLISPYEIDIVIPSKKLCIEYCGLYWHSEKVIEGTRKIEPSKYHLFKLNECQKKGYSLITIFEDEWIFKKDIVKSRLKNRLGIRANNKAYGRNCSISIIEPSLKNSFLTNFHIQGSDRSMIHLGAFYNNELVSVMTFSKGNISKGSKAIEGVWELNRFCSNPEYNTIGVAGKLLAHFKKNYKWKEIFSYADRRWSEGNMYRKLGFEQESITPANYWYTHLNKLKRYHRFAMRKRPDEPKDITERVLRIKEGYSVIWDCGNLKFKMVK